MTLAKVALRAACQVRIHCQHSNCELTQLQTTIGRPGFSRTGSMNISATNMYNYAANIMRKAR